LDNAEINILVDLQEWVSSNKNALTADWLIKMPNNVAIFQNGLLPNLTGVHAAAQHQAAATTAVCDANPAYVVPTTSLSAYRLKHDLKDYPEIKEHHFFNSWMDSDWTVAILHNNDNPSESAYVPVTDVEIAVF
jgi:cyclopropane fatty-acyl-phospholipid synthase-like methyltransferase